MYTQYFRGFACHFIGDQVFDPTQVQAWRLPAIACRPSHG